MKRLNKKGFTLVELLAVIIILAIVVGITIPAVLNTINSSRKSGGRDAAEIVANWIDDQYVVSSVDPGSLDAAWKDAAVCTENGSKCLTGVDVANSNTAFYNAAGLKTGDVDKVSIKINSTTGKSCVTLYVKSDGNYYISSNAKTQRYVAGKGCDSTTGAAGYYVCNAAADATNGDNCTLTK